MAAAWLVGVAPASAQAWRTFPGTYAVFETTLGRFVCRLYTAESPRTTSNFIALAEGTREFVDLKTRQRVKRPFYDGLTIHRVDPSFVIQGGDPAGDGSGGPGYTFADEFHPRLAFNRPGLLAMANAGPNTNGSQFFVTVRNAMPLNGRHAIFGEVVEGYDIVQNIARTPRDREERPLVPVVMNKVQIVRIGDR
ncbi:MAG: peptidylprolyl isomerase [Alphaproteobacteria bacterium]|nr:peptidylprolyl isomerase [Alphaproteobacteria bacterium]